MKSIRHRKSAKGQLDSESIKLLVSGEYTAVPVQDEAYGLEVDSRSVNSSSLFSHPTTMTYDKNKLSELFNAVDFSSHAKVIELLTQDPQLLIVRGNYTDHSELAEGGNSRQFISVSPWMLMLWMLDFRLIHLVLDHFKSKPSFYLANEIYNQFCELKQKGLAWNYLGVTQTSSHFDLTDTVEAYDAFLNYIAGKRAADQLLQPKKDHSENEYIDALNRLKELMEDVSSSPDLLKDVARLAKHGHEQYLEMLRYDKMMRAPAYDYSILAKLWNEGEKSVSTMQLLWPVWILSVFSSRHEFCDGRSLKVLYDVQRQHPGYNISINIERKKPSCEPIEYYQKYATWYALVPDFDTHKDRLFPTYLMRFPVDDSQWRETYTLHVNVKFIRKQRVQLEELSTCLATHFINLQTELEGLCAESKINKRSRTCVMM